RVTPPGTQVDLVETGPELNDEIGVRAIAFTAASGGLWLHGREDSGQGRLLKVDPSGEPDVLLAGFDLDGFLTGLTFDGTNLLAVNFSAQSIVRIAPATGQATGNFSIPDRSAQWRGIAAVGSGLFLLGDTGTEGRLLQVATPTP